VVSLMMVMLPIMGVGVGVAVGVLVGVDVGVFVGALVGVFVGVLVGVKVGVLVGAGQVTLLEFAFPGVIHRNEKSEELLFVS
jgi:hypothetical protein